MAPEFTLTGELGRGNLLQTRAFSKCLQECKVGTVYSLGSVYSRHKLSQSSTGLLFWIVLHQVAAGVTSSVDPKLFFNESVRICNSTVTCQPFIWVCLHEGPSNEWLSSACQERKGKGNFEVSIVSTDGSSCDLEPILGILIMRPYSGHMHEEDDEEGEQQQQ